MIQNSEQLFQLIKENSEPLKYNHLHSGLMSLSDEVLEMGKESLIFKTIAKYVRELGNSVVDFDNNDYSSLMVFIKKIQINDYNTFETYAAKSEAIKKLDLKSQALFLKLLQTINSDGISKLLLSEFIHLKNELPLFWADMYFEFDLVVSLNVLSHSSPSFDITAKLLDKWINSLSGIDSISKAKIETIHSFVLTIEPQSKIKIEWLEKNNKIFNRADNSNKIDNSKLQETIRIYSKRLEPTYAFPN
ncbi:MAG: hypothetical protein PHP53_15335 [Prolixibacteraceae bacterium]|nr:hypothetical protein [Prolixibacteraceae bacterium]